MNELRMQFHGGRKRSGPAGLFLVVAAAALAGSLLVGIAVAKKQPPAKPVDLNTATAGELAKLPGIGPATAKAIVQFREKSGPFRRVQDLLAIRGITRHRLDQLKPYVIITPQKHSKP